MKTKELWRFEYSKNDQPKFTHKFEMCKVTINLVISYTNNVTKQSYSYRWKKVTKLSYNYQKKNSNCNFVTSNELLPIPANLIITQVMIESNITIFNRNRI